jgi:hypothetical protein
MIADRPPSQRRRQAETAASGTICGNIGSYSWALGKRGPLCSAQHNGSLFPSAEELFLDHLMVPVCAHPAK